jgi:uncharacterized repeat protein (TIGR03803 family)
MNYRLLRVASSALVILFAVAPSVSATAAFAAPRTAIRAVRSPSVRPSTWTENVLHSFSDTNGDGAWLAAGVIVDGQLYGTTLLGGVNGGGTVFGLMPPRPGQVMWTETVLHAFGSTGDGNRLDAGLIADAEGQLYGTTAYGGANGWGTVFKLTPPARGQTRWTESVLYSFTNSNGDGSRPLGSLIRDARGALYGATASGGGSANCSPGGCGTVFKLAPPTTGQTSWTESVLYAFTDANGDGGLPLGGLIVDAHGALYNMTASGGAYNYGTVFKLTPPALGETAWKESVLYSFTNTNGDGYGAQDGLIADARGQLYGTLENGGANGWGIVFKLAPPTPGQTGWTESVLYSFTNTNGDGSNPACSLIADASGALYGTTAAGGGSANFPGGAGTVFKLTPPTPGRTTWTESVLHAFIGANGNGDGQHPQAGLIADGKGTLYGTTAFGGSPTCSIFSSVGCGTVFALSK